MNKNKLLSYYLRICPLLLIFISNFFSGIYSNEIVLGLLFNPIPSIIITYTIFTILIFLTKSLKKANYILIIIFFVLTLINQIKVYYMQEPIYISDILLLGGTGEILSITKGTILSFFKSNILYILLHLMVTLIMLLFIYKAFEIIEKRKIALIIPFTILIIFSMPFDFTTNCVKKIYDSNTIGDYQYITNKIEYYLYYGLVGSVYGESVESRIFKPSYYDENKINDVLTYESEDIKIKKPNIILFFSESFFDITKLHEELTFSTDILKEYHELSEKNKIIELISPTYGGLSSNVEFALLTGFNLAYYNKSYIPYLSLVNNEFYKKENILSILEENGYKNYVFSSADDSLYNAGKVYENFHFINNTNRNGDIKGYYLSDKEVTDSVIDLIEKEEKSVFYFVKTMQSHMPYLKDKYQNYDIEIKKSDFDEYDEGIILSYAQGIHDASKELKRLNDYLQKCKEDTIVIFIGDHLPYLNNMKGDNLINKFWYFNTNNNLINTYRLYNTEALILSNFNLKIDSANYLSPDLLMPCVLKSLGITLSPYYNYLASESINILPAYNRYISIDKEENMYYSDKLKGKMKEEFELRNSLQYKLYYMEK